jgi:hypothetical protein
MILGVRIGYALTAPKVAGAISQTMVHDYRDHGEDVNVGPPVGSVEVHVTGEEGELDSSTPKGKVRALSLDSRWFGLANEISACCERSVRQWRESRGRREVASSSRSHTQACLRNGVR